MLTRIPNYGFNNGVSCGNIKKDVVRDKVLKETIIYDMYKKFRDYYFVSGTIVIQGKRFWVFESL